MFFIPFACDICKAVSFWCLFSFYLCTKGCCRFGGPANIDIYFVHTNFILLSYKYTTIIFKKKVFEHLLTKKMPTLHSADTSQNQIKQT